MKKTPEIGQLVVASHLPEATMLRVKRISGKTMVGVIDATIEDEHPNQEIKWLDRSFFEFPTVLQRRNFTDANTSAA